MEKQLYGTVLLKAKKILDYIAESNTPPTLKEISDGINIPKPTVLKILQTLEYCGFVRAAGPNKEYYLGTTFIKYGDQAANSFDLKKLAMPFLNKLRDSTTEAVNLGIVENSKIVLLDRAQSLNNIRLDLSLGGTMQMYTSAMGKAILSYYSDNKLNEYIDHTALKAQTPNTLTTREALIADIQQVKKRGYAIDNIENQDGIYCIGFPLVKHDHIFGAFSISAPVFRVDDKKITHWIAQGKKIQQLILNQV
ncbi:IclR family transcriptional regulator [Lactobacillus sp. LL6]|uniref:IclR family transcriptional regulator n=1 Tax=Lactobacillus sp. LL6 TaxID=2596827 RepID=UPI001185BD12|nr:IclR family transcriptional regulator [Lactobacillus sp. LL6]TSO25350.1 IclR family transcriptional regulator [Lactobacillus sp. LL6]